MMWILALSLFQFLISFSHLNFLVPLEAISETINSNSINDDILSQLSCLWSFGRSPENRGNCHGCGLWTFHAFILISCSCSNQLKVKHLWFIFVAKITQISIEKGKTFHLQLIMRQVKRKLGHKLLRPVLEHTNESHSN